MRKKSLGFLAAGVLALSGLAGCKTSGPIADYEERGGVYSGINWRAAYSPTYYDLKLKEAKDIPINPADSGFLSGSTSARAGNGLDYAAFSLGLEGLVGSKNFALTGGLDMEFDLSSIFQHRTYMYDFTQQQSDTRPADHGSFVYDRVDPPLVAPIPFVGAKIMLGQLVISPELGFPYKKFRRSWGNHRYSKEEELGSQSDGQWGLKPSLSVYYEIDKKTKLGLQVSQEKYNLKFGDIKSTQAMLILSWDF